MDFVKLNINGKEIQVPRDTTILQAAEMAGIEIPRLCYDPELSKTGSCRMCVVEIKGNPLLPASCVTPVLPGMEVQTDSPRVVEARKTILQLLIANHPMDCVTCDKQGDCRLADYCYRYGVKESPCAGEKQQYPVDDSNPFVIRDPNKCILCGACARACNELTGQDNLAYINRGFRTKVTTAGDVPYIESDCVFCGQCVAVCPTGALLEKSMAGQARRWEIDRVQTTCPFCGTGCNFDLAVKNGKIIGVLSNPEAPVNGRSLCVKGRFGWDYIYNKKRLTRPLVKSNGQFREASWDEALDMIARRLNEIKSEYGSDSFAALSSARCTNEENYLVQKFTRACMGTNNVDHCART